VRLADSRRTLARNETLVKQQLVSESALDASRAEVNALAARLEASKAQVKVSESQLTMRKIDYDDLQVRAPFAGVVISKGRPAGRDGLADVGRRRLHAHWHRDHRRHGFARSGSGRQ
jgi:multidrug efflux pump subunit AcrA (membrane-fusion protein)